MGNICRSPTAEGVFRKHVKQSELSNYILIDSAGTHGLHEGKSPDRRAIRAAKRRQIDLRKIRARPVQPEDFSVFDYIVAMDLMNLGVLEDMCPDNQRHKLSLMMDYVGGREIVEVPDPYYGGKKAFEFVLDLVEEASQGLLDRIRADLDAAGIHPIPSGANPIVRK